MGNTDSKQGKNQAIFGIIAIIAAVFLMALQDAMIKLFATDLSLGQIFTLRSLIATPVFLFAIWLHNPSGPQNAHLFCRWSVIRAILLTLMYVTLYAVIPFIPLSLMAAGFYTGPIFIVIFSALVIGESVTAKNWIAGVIMSITMAWLNLEAWTIGQSKFILGTWAPMDFSEWGLILLLAILLLGIGVLLATAYQVAPPAIIASFDYSYLFFAALFGFIIFSETPKTVTIIGITLIAGAGVFCSKNIFQKLNTVFNRIL